MMNNRTVRTRGRLAIVAAAAMGVVVSACGGGQDEAAPTEPMGVDTTPAELAPAQYAPDPAGRVTLPLDAYKDRLTASAGGLTADAMECFAAVGVEEARAGVHVGRAEQHDRRYSVTDESVAARYGYHAPKVKDPRDALLDAADEDQLVAATACLSELPDPSPEILEGEQLVSDIQAEAWWAAQEDPRVVNAFEGWSACMARSGYEYERPMDANDDPQWATPRATAAEITVAKVDVACKQEVDLVAIWSQVEAEYQKSLIAQHQAALNHYDAALSR